MKLFKVLKYFGKSYIVFGLGVLFGSAVASVTTYTVMSLCYGIPNTAKILEIQECLQEKFDE